MIENLCLRYHALPSQILQEDVSVLRMIDLLNTGKKK